MGPWMLLLLSCNGRRGEAVEEICEKVVSCDTYGWTSTSECQDGWLDSPEHGTECAYDSPYLSCAEGCLYYDCEPFEDCELYCWVSHCL